MRNAIFAVCLLAGVARTQDEGQLVYSVPCEAQLNRQHDARMKLRDAATDEQRARAQDAITLADENYTKCKTAFDAFQAEKAQAEAEFTAAREARVQANLADRKVMRIVLSAWICGQQRRRSDALRAIAAEKKYSRLGGVVNMKTLYEFQTRARRADEATVLYRKELRATRAAALSCRDRAVATLSWCLAEEDGRDCDRDLFDVGMFIRKD